MNHIYKVIWSRVKNSYVVVSEIAGTARKSGRVRVSKNTLAAVLAAFLLTGISVSPVSAALDGVNTFVEPGNQNIKIGNDIDLRNNSTKNGAIAIGDHAQIDDYVMQEGSIAIGKNAFVENMWGTQDKIFRFGMTSTDPSRTDHLLPAGIAIGQNTYTRSGITRRPAEYPRPSGSLHDRWTGDPAPVCRRVHLFPCHKRRAGIHRWIRSSEL